MTLPALSEHRAGLPDPPPEPAGIIRVVSWSDGIPARSAFHVRSRYAERFWLPILGPSALWFLRRLVDGLEASPSGYLLALEPTARSLGLGGLGGRHSPFRRAVLRCCRFRALRRLGPSTMAVRIHLDPLPAHLLGRLPEDLQAEHPGWMQRPSDLGGLRRTVRRLALELSAVLEDPEAVETHLHQAGLHPALAHEAAEWAHDLRRRLRGSAAQGSV